MLRCIRQKEDFDYGFISQLLPHRQAVVIRFRVENYPGLLMSIVRCLDKEIGGDTNIELTPPKDNATVGSARWCCMSVEHGRLGK
jgi:hypothetical protein